MRLPEIVEVGFYNSNIVNKNAKISKSRRTTMFELELPIEEGGIAYVNSSQRQIKPNMLICVKPDQVRHTKFPHKCYYVHISIQEGILYDILINTPTFFETDKFEAYKQLFISLNNYNPFDEGEEIIMQSILLKLIYTISKDISSNSKNGKLSEKKLVIERSLMYINKHLSEDLRLETVAAEMSFSPIHFHNTFKQTIGKTLRDYIEEQRIKKATNLLLTTSNSLTQIAYECGFSSQSYFSYVFKRRMKKTPREYVKEIHKRYET